MLSLLEEREKRKARRKLYDLYPETGPLRRELYKKHMEFFAAGAKFNERCMMAANRVGKTWGVGGYEFTLHVTGEYPDWWTGKRFNEPVDTWAAGDTTETTRDIVQMALSGVGGERADEEFGLLGTGLIPAHLIIGQPTRRQGVAGAFDTMMVRHASGGVSRIGFKSYDQGRKKFQGTAKHVVWLDEECPQDVYTECLTRTMTVDGLVMCTFTPLNGMTDLAHEFFKAIGA